MATTSPYYAARMQYKRSCTGLIFETSGKHVRLATALLLKCLSARESSNRSLIIQPHGRRFTSREYPVDAQSFPYEPDFDCVQLCELDFGTHITGILSLLYGNQERHLHSLCKEKLCLRKQMHQIWCELREVDKNTSQEPRTIKIQRRLWARYLHYEDIWHRLDQMQRAIYAPTSDNAPPLAFGEYFALVVLSQKSAAAVPLSLFVRDPPLGGCSNNAHTSAKGFSVRVRDVFENLLHCPCPTKDQWHSASPSKGSNLFIEKVHYFTARNLPVHFCLPAFPCKSSNPSKTVTTLPDGAEYEALANLHHFCRAVKQIYPPGAILTIVSDGHVFSDCIGVDDDQIFKYTDRLKLMSDTIFGRDQDQLQSSGDKDSASPLSFLNLRDIFQANPLVRSHFRVHFAFSTITHPLSTSRHPVDEICRRLMVRSCGSNASILIKIVRKDSNHALTALYRGFSRFMLDDLGANQDMRGRSMRQCKRTCGRVAMEMIQRNQAYSHLVEFVMPKAVRLSIHAHNNAGPKFAVNLLPRGKFRTVRSFNDLAGRSIEGDAAANDGLTEHLHIPTPWHNILAEIEGEDRLYVCKAGLIASELQRPESRYCPHRSHFNGEHPRGGRYILILKSGVNCAAQGNIE